jgi:hypothetical protein
MSAQAMIFQAMGLPSVAELLWGLLSIITMLAAAFFAIDGSRRLRKLAIAGGAQIYWSVIMLLIITIADIITAASDLEENAISFDPEIVLLGCSTLLILSASHGFYLLCRHIIASSSLPAADLLHGR